MFPRIRPTTFILSGLFVNGLIRKRRQLQTTSIGSSAFIQQMTPFQYSYVLCLAAFNHTWLFPYHFYIDNIETPNFNDSEEFINVLYM